MTISSVLLKVRTQTVVYSRPLTISVRLMLCIIYQSLYATKCNFHIYVISINTNS